MPRRLAIASPVVVLVAVILLAFVSGQSAPPLYSAPDGPAIRPWINTDDRAAVIEAFTHWYGAPQPEVAWTGAYQGCSPGDSSDLLREATIDRVNFFRAMAGVPAAVQEDPGFSELAQAGALMMSAEGKLSHYPDHDYQCFTSDGELAAANSNLYLGRTGPWAVDGYIEDPGDKNVDVGHRITILHPPTTRMGVGHVAGDESRYPANVLWVFDDDVFDKTTNVREQSGFVAWPPRGYVPGELVYPRWSFSLSEADLSAAELTMTANGEPIPYSIVARLSKEGEVPSSVLVWEPSQSVMQATEDITYTVSISGVGVPLSSGVDLAALALVDQREPSDRLERFRRENPDREQADSANQSYETMTFSYEVTVLASSEGGLRSAVMAALEPASDRARSVVDSGRSRLRSIGL